MGCSLATRPHFHAFQVLHSSHLDLSRSEMVGLSGRVNDDMVTDPNTLSGDGSIAARVPRGAGECDGLHRAIHILSGTTGSALVPWAG